MAIIVSDTVGILALAAQAVAESQGRGGCQRWYAEFVPKADKLYDEHLEELQRGHDG